MNKRKIIIFAGVICTIICVCIFIVVKRNNVEADIENESTDYEYGVSPGNLYNGGCQGKEALYFQNYYPNMGSGLYKIFKVEAVDKVYLVGHGRNLVHYDGYIYCLGESDSFIVRLNEETGQTETVIDAGDVVSDKGECEYASIELIQLIDGEVRFDIHYKISGYEEYHDACYMYNCNDGTIRELEPYTGPDDLYYSSMNAEYFTQCESYYKFLPWDYNFGKRRQYYGEYIYTYAALPEDEVYNNDVCIYAPRDFCVVNYKEAFNSKDSNKEDCKKVIDTNVSAFNVGFENIYYVKKEDGRNVCSIWKAELDGSNPQKIAEIETETEMWGACIVVGDNVIVCTLSDWEKNKLQDANNREYEKYVISIDGSVINRLEDVLVEE